MTVSRKRTEAYLSFGSNIGDRELNLLRASELITETGDIGILKKSSIIETEPYDYYDQPFFLNQVICINTSLSPTGLLERVLEIEKIMGRERIIEKGPRLIDIDILLYGDHVVSEPGLVIPHTEIMNRGFLVYLLQEIECGIVHPLTGKKIMEESHELY